MEYAARYDSPLGGITLVSDGEALTGLRFDDRNFSALRQEPRLPVFEQTTEWLTLYFSGKIPDFTPPLRWSATPFRERVWRMMLTIPYGETATYGELARRLASLQRTERVFARAVGGAAGHNPILLIVPCHRVLGAGGALTGYAGGLERKRRLLALENTENRRRGSRLKKSDGCGII